jgi:FkbM family methyltransferase
MYIDFIGKMLRAIPYIPGKGFFVRSFVVPFLRGKGYELVVEMRNPGGGKLLCNLDDWIPWNVFAHGSYKMEANYEEFMLDKLSNCHIVFDVGANVGYYTVQMGRILKDVGHVYAFEPLSYQCSLLEKNIDLNDLDNVTVIKAIVSDSSESRRIYFSGAESTGTSSLIIKSDQYEDVISTTIDQFCKEKGIGEIDLIKIDVEGYELTVLKGMSELLANGKIKMLFLEIENELLTEAGTSAEEIVAFLDNYHYQPFSIKSGREEEYSIGMSESLVYFTRAA